MSKIDFKGSIVLNPVPVVLVTCRNNLGLNNVFTVAWTGTICTKPPMLSISVRPERLSYEYIKETMEFTINLPKESLVKETDFCGVRSGRVIDKIKEMNFTMKEGTNVNVPYIDQCPVNIECKVKNIIKLGTHDLFIAEVLGSHIDSSIIDEKGKIHFEWANLISYSHGEYYPLPKEAIGKFGFSVAKNKIVSKKNHLDSKDKLKEKASKAKKSFTSKKKSKKYTNKKKKSTK